MFPPNKIYKRPLCSNGKKHFLLSCSYSLSLNFHKQSELYVQCKKAFVFDKGKESISKVNTRSSELHDYNKRLNQKMIYGQKASKSGGKNRKVKDVHRSFNRK